MENRNKVQGRGFFLLGGQVFGRNIEPGSLLRMDKDLIKRIEEEKGISVSQINSQLNSVGSAVVKRKEEIKDTTVNRNY